MENHHLSPTNNANMSKDKLISDNHIDELPISVVFSNKNSNGDQIKSAEEIEALMKSFPPGFRFYPTDCELITHYLLRKIDNLPLEPNKIYEMNIYKYNPETIAAYVKPTTAEKVWYVLTPRDRKYQRGHRPNRAAGNGYWKATGADKPIKNHKNSLIGSKRALVYYNGKAPKGKKTDWIMHEYRVPGIPDISHRDAKDWKLDEWVLCKMYNRKDMDNSMFTQRKRSGGNHQLDIDEVKDTCDGQVHEYSNENLSSHKSHGTFGEDSTRNDNTNCNNNNNHAIMFSEGTYQESTQKDPKNCTNNSNHATTFLHPQVPTGLSTFPQLSYMPTFCNYQSCEPQFNNGTASTSMTNDIFHHQIAPSPMMIEPISSERPATSNSIGHDHTMKNEGFDIPFFSSCIGGGGGYGEYLGHDQYDPVDQYLVNNYEMDMISSEYNTNNFVNGGTSKSKGDC